MIERIELTKKLSNWEFRDTLWGLLKGCATIHYHVEKRRHDTQSHQDHKIRVTVDNYGDKRAEVIVFVRPIDG